MLTSDAKVKAELDKWQIKFDAQPIRVDGRILDKEVLVFGNVSTLLKYFDLFFFK